MRHVIVCLATLATYLPFTSPAANAAPQQVPDLGSQVRGIFAAKCVECHAATLHRPKGKFGYILDLKRVAANPKIVVPFHPETSKLWTQIDEGDMPPDDAKEGSLTPAEEHLIHLWVEAGAPAPLTISASAATVAVPDAPAEPLPRRILQLLGKLHVLVIHFPIGLLAAAAIGESWWIWKKYPGRSPFVRFCVMRGGAGAIVAAILGWIHATYGGFGADAGQAMMLHRWLGTTAAVGAVVTLGLSEWDEIRKHRSLLFRGVLFASAAIVGAAGHFGGMLVYGSDYFRF